MSRAVQLVEPLGHCPIQA